jgi:hypothetical protein
MGLFGRGGIRIGGRSSILSKPLGTGRGSVSHGLGKLERLLREVTANLGREATQAKTNIDREATAARSKLDRTATRALNDLGREATRAKTDIDREATKAKGDIDREATKLKADVDREATNAKKEIDREASKAKGNADREATKLKRNIDREATRAKQDIEREATRFKQDIDSQATKAKEDFDRELTRAKEDIDEAVQAATTFVEAEVEALNETLSEAEKRIREGKALDALWHLATEPLKSTKDAVAQAATDSALLQQLGAMAATAYGGPAGASAYTAWLTYERTGSLESAMRAGVVAGITSAGGRLVESVEGSGLTETLRREITRASVNAAAVAASGGSQEDIQEAFMASATGALRDQAMGTVKAWVEAEIVPRVGPLAQSQAPESGGIAVVQMAKSLPEELEKFSEKWSALADEAERISAAVNDEIVDAAGDGLTQSHGRGG